MKVPTGIKPCTQSAAALYPQAGGFDNVTLIPFVPPTSKVGFLTTLAATAESALSHAKEITIRICPLNTRNDANGGNVGILFIFVLVNLG